MRIFNRRELLTINAAVCLDKYDYDYNFCEYQQRVGTNEICRTRHINSLIEMIANNSGDYLEIIKQLNDDVEFITFVMKTEKEPADTNQLSDACAILNILSELS